MTIKPAIAVLFLGLSALDAGGQELFPELPPAGTPVEEPAPVEATAPGSAEAIRAATPDGRFLPEPVRALPEGRGVPTPAAFLGRLAGTPGGPAASAAVQGYLRALAEASDRVRVVPIGTSEEGREILLAAISDAANLAALDDLRLLGARLADPRVTPAAEAGALVGRGKLFYLLWSGARATDLAAPEALTELAFRLAVSERPEIRAVRREAVVLLVPLLDPDARDRAAAWYERNLRGRSLSPAVLAELGRPPVEGAWAADDGDKDGLRLALASSRALQDAFFSYLPQVVHRLRDGDTPFVTLRGAPAGGREGVSDLAAAEAAKLSSWGVPGVRTIRDPDAGWPGHLGAVGAYHNSLTRTTSVLSLPVFEARPLETEAGTVSWTGRSAVNLAQAAALAALEQAAGQRAELLSRHFSRATRAVEEGRTRPPHAFVLPAGAGSRDRLALLLEGLAARRIEGGRLAADLGIEGRSFPAGSVVVLLDQPYREAALALLGERQAGPASPSEAAGWSLPWLYGVPAVPVADPRILEASLVFGSEPPTGSVGGVGEELFLLADDGQADLLRARVLLGAHQVDAVEVPFRAAGRSWPAGSWIVQAPRADVLEVARQTGLSFEATPLLPDVRRHIVDLPRLGLYVPWTDTRGAGWVRLALERAALPFTLVTDADLRAGGLGERFDVLLLPDARGGLVRQLAGFDPRRAPWTWVGGGGLPSGGEISGGPGAAGLTALERFVRDGGTLLALGRGVFLPLAAGLLRGFDVPAGGEAPAGSEIAAVNLASGHPLTYGYGERVSLFVDEGTWLAAGAEEADGVLVRFGLTAGKRPTEPAGGGEPAADVAPPGIFEIEDLTEEMGEVESLAAASVWSEVDRPVLTGTAHDGVIAAGRPAIIDQPAGRGRVVAFAFDPFARALPVSDLRFVYNALLHWNDLPRGR